MSKFDTILSDGACVECERRERSLTIARERIAQLQEIVRAELSLMTEAELDSIVESLPQILRAEARQALLKANAPQ